MLLAAVALALAWLFGAVALNAPGAKELRKTVQRSEILGSLNEAFPPSGGFLKALNRIDPAVAVQGPDVDLGPARLKARGRPRGEGGGRQRRAGAGDRLRPRGVGLGLDRLARRHRHQRPRGRGRGGHRSQLRRRGRPLRRHPDPLRPLQRPRDPPRRRPRRASRCPSRREVESGTSGAVLGYPENGPFTISPARAGPTAIGDQRGLLRARPDPALAHLAAGRGAAAATRGARWWTARGGC